MQERVVIISVVIVTWNAKHYALECLTSLFGENQQQMEIIVVDNCSSDGTPDAVNARFPQARLIRNESNLGFSRANNIGIAAATGQYICLINSDVVVPAGCLEAMTTLMDSNPTIGLLGPKMLTPDGGVGQSVMLLPTVWNSFCCALGLHSVFKTSKTLGGYMMNGFLYDKMADVEVLTGWFWMVRRSALEQVGGLDERYFFYGEDIDWSYRFRAGGWRVVFYPQAEALHYGGGSSKEVPVRFYIEMRRANLQYFRKHHGPAGEVGYRLVLWMHELVRVILYGAKYFARPAYRSQTALKVRRGLACLTWLAGIRANPTGR